MRFLRVSSTVVINLSHIAGITHERWGDEHVDLTIWMVGDDKVKVRFKKAKFDWFMKLLQVTAYPYDKEEGE